jgi:hypothetical protein
MADALLREGLAARFLRGPATLERIRKLLRLARRGTRADFAATLAAIPDAAVRAQVEQAAAQTRFAG